MNVFDLYAKISLDSGEYEKGLDDASIKSSGIAEKLKTGFATFGKVAVAGIGAATTAVGALTKAAVEGYAQYEQLVGGVETLFGESLSLEEFADAAGYTVEEIRSRYNELANAPNVVMENAANAFKTAGMSANEYMDTVTSFSASLIQSLHGDTAEAADAANQIITDMSDNANKMGTDMTMIQNAYQGFAKGNYTMLDNLKLGYGGTATEMARLVNESGVLGESMQINLNDTKNIGAALQEVGFAKIAEAIHAVQTEMGITGTTAKEASTTIEGSVNSMKASWSNLLVGVADDNADFDTLISNFVDSVATAGENILPRIEIALIGIGDLVTGLAPVISEAIPGLVQNVLPSLLDAGISLLNGLSQGILNALPELVAMVPNIINTLINTLMELLPQLIDVGFQTIVTLANGLAQSLPEMVPQIVDIILEIVDTLTDPNNLSMLIDAAIAIVIGLADGIIASLPELIDRAPEIVENLVQALVDNVPKLLEAAYQIIIALAQGIILNLPQILDAAFQIIESLISGFFQGAGKIFEAGLNIAKQIWNSITSINWIDLGKNIISGIVSGFTGAIGSAISAVKNAASSIFNAAKDFFQISSPSKLFKNMIGKNIALGLANGIEDNEDSAVDAMTSMSKKISEVNMDFGISKSGFNASNNYSPYASNYSGGTIINQYIQAVPMTPAELARQSVDAFDRLQWA